MNTTRNFFALKTHVIFTQDYFKQLCTKISLVAFGKIFVFNFFKLNFYKIKMRFITIFVFYFLKMKIKMCFITIFFVFFVFQITILLLGGAYFGQKDE